MFPGVQLQHLHSHADKVCVSEFNSKLNLPLFFRNSLASLRSPDSAAVHPEVSEDQFKPFEPATESFDESPPADCYPAKDSSKNNAKADSLNVSGLDYSPARASGPPSSLAPHKVGVEKGDFALKEGPQVFGGVRAAGARPSSVSRLSLVDRKWLERCQVFGEMENEVKPGAGNQENVHVTRKEEAGGVSRDEENGGRETATTGRDGLKSLSPDKRHSREQPPEKVNNRQEGVIEPASTLLSNTEEESKQRKNSNYRQNKGGKRQREEEGEEGEVSEEGGLKKRRRKAKKESSEVSLSPGQTGAKKKKGKKREEDGDAKEEKDTKLPKKVSTRLIIIPAN